MNTNKRFAFYALESFDGEIQRQGLAIYDKAEDVPAVNLDDPDVTVEILFTGDLDNPYEKEKFYSLLELLGVNREDITEEYICNADGLVCQGRPILTDDTYYSKDEAVLEALASATEDNIFKTIGGAAKAIGQAIATKSAGNKLDKSEKEQTDVVASFEQNEKVIDKALTTDQVQHSYITPEVAARYYILQLAEGKKPEGLFICLDGQVKDKKTGDRRIRDAKNIAASLPADAVTTLTANVDADTDDKKKLYEKAQNSIAQAIFSAIKSQVPKNYSISGYTTSASKAQKFKESLIEDKGISANFKEMYDKGQFDELNKIWEKSTDSDKIKMLDAILGKTQKISKEVRAIVLSISEGPFTSVPWAMIRYYLSEGGTAPLDVDTFRVVAKSSSLQKLFGRVGFKGLDLSVPLKGEVVEVPQEGAEPKQNKVYSQISIIIAAERNIGRDTVDKLHQGEKNIWLPANDMIKIAQEGLSSSTSRRTAARSTTSSDDNRSTTANNTEPLTPVETQEEVNKFLELVKGGRMALTADQINAISSALRKGGEGSARRRG